MGQILSNPVVEKEHHSGFDSFTSFGLCAMQGWRMSMEDSHVVELNVMEDDDKDHIAYYCVFDGHGGSTVAQYCGFNAANVLKRQTSFQNGNFRQALIDTFLAIDEDLLDNHSFKNDHSGCTATSLLISKLNKVLLCGNSGDSRTVLSTSGYAKALSFDHKPTLASENSRIVAADGFVEMDRVNGNLALSRALGDFEFKSNKKLSPYEQVVTCIPDVIQHTLNYEDDEFVILACDGIWDCLSSQECVELIHYGISLGNMSLNDISSKIIDVCCAPSTDGPGIGCDNMSIVIVALLKDEETTEQWFERMREKKYSNFISFEERRRRVFQYFKFPEGDNDSLFDITTKKNHNHLNHGLTIDDSMEIDDTDDDADKHVRTQGGSVDLFSLEALLDSSGIRISQDGNNTSYIHGAALTEMLASLSGATANELRRQDRIDEYEEDDIEDEDNENNIKNEDDSDD
ncbi:hypothetical protein Kpol_1030p39 [Vanderwaltozyma polyspora DSM 70294]|uniref:protein-serine/threonine phosphatase n=1 Tax=Vanderwaltozyma polyspora (strain ATCC 22028 / DSM 70294 / BCRC 21397 / CBS 2163 / NBRC 10782 / NRRL Y-8283 / UCD 57-17) TaxID=436907 RepID=A7TMV7_VANPO|nr:uncharacterized protein Kpol_1030p39 [Vanderwaltozyma polyspora DSM 70294]EDO16429.1 hypothetical protein Kpol_1030p39 [Vanderwaltozyma polyspora DSM 70294]